MTIRTKAPTALLLARVAVCALASCAVLSALIGVKAQAGKNPYDKDRLLKVVRLNALSTQEVIGAVQQRGVDFETTAGVEAEFRQAGARPELIDAIRGNYRAPATEKPATPPPSTSSTKPTGNVPAGPPLSKNEIITLLQSGVPSARVEQFVEARGVSFAITPDISREMTRAGGTRSLVGAVTEKGMTPPAGPSPSASIKATKSGPDYDDLTDQATGMLQANNSSSAIRLLQQAVAMDASRPTAYQLLGFAELYGSHDILAAERSMRAALERGGAAAFRVYHDHDGFFNTYCQGSFFVTKSRVTFKADDGNHTFEAEDSAMKEVELNGFVGSQFGAFHLKVIQDSAKNKPKNYNFAPATAKQPESRLIVNLITSYK